MTAPGASPSSPRFHDLDALRAFTMALGILTHASLFLVPTPGDRWPVQSAWLRETALTGNPYAYGFVFIYGFRLQVFFILSGFFTAMLWRRRGLRALGTHRLKRIALPLAACMFTIIPVLGWIDAGRNFHFAWGEPWGAQTLAWLDTARGFFPTQWHLAWTKSLYHLWFLRDLLLIGALFILLVRLGLRFRHPLWWLLIPLTAAPQYFMRGAFGATPGLTITPQFLPFAYFTAFFLFGVFFYQRGMEARRWWAVGLLPSPAIFLAGLAFAFPKVFGLPESAAWVIGAATVLQLFFAWLMCFGMMGLFRLIAARERFWVRYLSDSCYWLYVAHLPLVLVGQKLLVNAPISVHLQFALILAGTCALLLATYHLCVRYTWIGTMLNGKRVPRAAPALTGAAG